LYFKYFIKRILHNTGFLGEYLAVYIARTGYADSLFWSYDLDLDPRSLIYECDLTILMMYLRTCRKRTLQVTTGF